MSDASSEALVAEFDTIASWHRGKQRRKVLDLKAQVADALGVHIESPAEQVPTTTAQAPDSPAGSTTTTTAPGDPGYAEGDGG